MKPHRVRMAHGLIVRYGLYKHMEVRKWGGVGRDGGACGTGCVGGGWLEAGLGRWEGPPGAPTLSEFGHALVNNCTPPAPAPRPRTPHPAPRTPHPAPRTPHPARRIH